MNYILGIARYAASGGASLVVVAVILSAVIFDYLLNELDLEVEVVVVRIKALLFSSSYYLCVD